MKPISQKDLISIISRSSCLIAKPNTNVPNCHEYDYCSCDIKKLTDHISYLENLLNKKEGRSYVPRDYDLPSVDEVEE